MIETPAAVMVSDELAQEVDFFSVGTNDLTQYTLAIDRQNQMLDNIYDSHHPAILRMLKMIVDNDELSVSPTFTLGLRKKIRETSVSD